MNKTFRDEIRLEGQGSKRTLIYFLPGNPGVVEYYRNFLSDLHGALTEEEDDAIIYGHSHDGFELGSSKSDTRPPFTLAQEIESAKRRLQALATAISRTSMGSKEEPLKVVLIGHSVGSYMVMELVSWWQQRLADNPSFGANDFQIVGGVCLFPTVVDLAKSPRGKVMKWVLAMPFISLMASWLAMLLSFLPTRLLNWPKILTPDGIPEYWNLTKAVAQSPYGARQAVYLAADEMIQIREDKWHPANVWGAHVPDVTTTEAAVQAASDTPRTKLFFYWGRDDYWVDNTTRDRLIKERARRHDDKKPLNRPTMILDRYNMDHCFSLDRQHCRIVAQQVAEWVKELKD